MKSAERRRPPAKLAARSRTRACPGRCRPGRGSGWSSRRRGCAAFAKLMDTPLDGKLMASPSTSWRHSAAALGHKSRRVRARGSVSVDAKHWPYSPGASVTRTERLFPSASASRDRPNHRAAAREDEPLLVSGCLLVLDLSRDIATVSEGSMSSVTVLSDTSTKICMARRVQGSSVAKRAVARRRLPSMKAYTHYTR